MQITATREINYTVDLSNEDVFIVAVNAISKAYELPRASSPDEVFEKDGEWWIREEFHGHTSYFEERKLRKITKSDKEALFVIAKLREEYEKPFSGSYFRVGIKDRPTTISER